MDAERVSTLLDKFKKAVDNFRRKTEEIGDPHRDTPAARAKLGQLRGIVGNLESEIQRNLDAAPPRDRTWETLRSQFREAKKTFQGYDVRAKEREKKAMPSSAFGAEQDAARSETESAATAGSRRAPDLSQLRRVDLSEFATEEVIQSEKLKTAREIESEAAELHSTYIEFNQLTKEQQVGLNTMQTNVQSASKSVDKGTVELHTAGEHQKKGRKLMCIILLVLAVVIGFVVIFVVAK